jgi:putative membrane protein
MAGYLQSAFVARKPDMLWLNEQYLLIKSFHMVAVISWLAALLYLPRLYVYHADAADGSDNDRLLRQMEYRLLRYIMNPAMVATVILGVLLLLVLPPGSAQGWLHAKVALVALLLGLHGVLARWRRRFAQGRNTHTARFYKWVNEVPTVLMIGIVLLAVLKPF